MQNSYNTLKGRNNNQVNGDNNIINQGTMNIFESRPPIELTMTRIFTFLEIFYESDIPEDEEYNLTLPANIIEKFKSNNAARYLELSALYTQEFLALENVIVGFSDSMKIIKKLIHLFIDAQKNAVNGDDILDKLSINVRDLIKKDARFDVNKYMDEDLDSFVFAFIFYGIYKCKILKNPNKK